MFSPRAFVAGETGVIQPLIRWHDLVIEATLLDQRHQLEFDFATADPIDPSVFVWPYFPLTALWDYSADWGDRGEGTFVGYNTYSGYADINLILVPTADGYVGYCAYAQHDDWTDILKFAVAAVATYALVAAAGGFFGGSASAAAVETPAAVPVNTVDAGWVSGESLPAGDASVSAADAGWVSGESLPAGDASTSAADAGWVSGESLPAGDASASAADAGWVSGESLPAGDASASAADAGWVSGESLPTGSTPVVQAPGATVSTAALGTDPAVVLKALSTGAGLISTVSSLTKETGPTASTYSAQGHNPAGYGMPGLARVPFWVWVVGAGTLGLILKRDKHDTRR